MATILALEDDVLSQQLLRLIFERESHKVSISPTCKEAWTLLENDLLPDFVVIDSQLRDGKGIEFLKSFRSNFLYEKTPVLICATAPSRDLVMQFTFWKIQNILVKPYIQEKILNELQKALDVKPYNDIFEREDLFCQRAAITPDLYKETLGMGVKAISADLEELKVAIQQSATHQIQNHLSRIQSLGSNIGFRALANYCQDVIRKISTAGAPLAYLTQVLIDLQLMFRVFAGYAEGKLVISRKDP